MKFAAYKRADSEEDAKRSSANLRSQVISGSDEMLFFAHDLMSGQRGLLRMMRAARDGKIGGVIVEDLSDLGRDLVSLIKTLNELLDIGVTVQVTNEKLRISQALSGYYSPESRMTRALQSAHAAYVNENRRSGIAAALAGGAKLGRPQGLVLGDVVDVLDEMAAMNEGDAPTVRAVMERVECSHGKAAQLLRAWRSSRSAEAPPLAANACI